MTQVSPSSTLFVGKDRHKFSAAHMTVFPDGSKERLHGHNFQVSASIELRSLALADFVDFGVIKGALEQQCGAWDERLLLALHCPHLAIIRREPELEFRLCGQRYVVPADEAVLVPIENITVENLAIEFAARWIERLGPAVTARFAALEVSIAESPGQGGRARVRLG